MEADRIILLDLVAGQSTATSISDRTGIETGAVLEILRRLHAAALVAPFAVSILTAWRLTDKARKLHADFIQSPA